MEGALYTHVDNNMCTLWSFLYLVTLVAIIGLEA